jgi:hypothetical protein
LPPWAVAGIDTSQVRNANCRSTSEAIVGTHMVELVCVGLDTTGARYECCGTAAFSSEQRRYSLSVLCSFLPVSVMREHNTAATRSSTTKTRIEYWKLPNVVFTDSIRTMNTTEPI